jgi:plastocyanin
MVLAPVVLGGLLALAAPSPEAGQLSGRVEVAGSGAIAIAGSEAVVWIPGVRGPAPQNVVSTITQRQKRFEPHVLAVTRGTVVSFPNLDGIHHNVFSVSPGNAFDLGLYRGGASREVKFEKPGLVRIYCNIHPQMAAYVFVVDGTAFAVADSDGRYRIAGVPPGPHAVRVWHEKGGGKETTVEIRAGETSSLDLVLDAGGFRSQPHKNKHGRDYPPVGRDLDRY